MRCKQSAPQRDPSLLKNRDETRTTRTPAMLPLSRMGTELPRQMWIAVENARLRDALAHQTAQLANAERKMREALSELARESQFKIYGQLSASILHEIVQPVAALDASARAGLRWLNREPPDIERAREAFVRVAACASRSRSIVESLRAKVRNYEREYGAFDLREALQSMVKSFSVVVASMSVKLELISPMSHVAVKGEKFLLEQAILNLILNGAEAMQSPFEGERRLVLVCEVGGDSISIHIDDNGVGVDPILVEQLMEPLYTTKSEGMGMGLAICKSIVEAHHGCLTLRPRPTGGTRATISLPRSSESCNAIKARHGDWSSTRVTVEGREPSLTG